MKSAEQIITENNSKSYLKQMHLKGSKPCTVAVKTSIISAQQTEVQSFKIFGGNSADFINRT